MELRRSTVGAGSQFNLTICNALKFWTHLGNRHKSNNVIDTKLSIDKDTPIASDPSDPDNEKPPTPLPDLPVELWARILGFIVRLPGSDAVDDEDHPFDPWHVNESANAKAIILKDRKTLRSVCKNWRSIVFEIMAAYLTVCCNKHLLELVERLERSRETCRGDGLGELTRRIDFRLHESNPTNGLPSPISSENVIRLLRCTPNLAIYINSNRSRYFAESQTPTRVIETLVSVCGKSLRRVEWTCPGECPSWDDVELLCRGSPGLRTLRLACIYSYPSSLTSRPPLVLPHLKALSLGRLPSPSDIVPSLPRSWDDVLSLFSDSTDQLPSLERLQVESFSNISFFHAHGSKIRQLRVDSTAVISPIPSAIDLCPELHSLVIYISYDLLTAESIQLRLPQAHPVLRRICIFPVSEDPVQVPPRVFASGVLDPLDALLMAIELVDLPRLVQIRIRNVGVFVDLVDHPVFLRIWWRRWNIRGVRFEDKMGNLFESVGADEDVLLDSLRG